jgi:hypothetical protein
MGDVQPVLRHDDGENRQEIETADRAQHKGQFPIRIRHVAVKTEGRTGRSTQGSQALGLIYFACTL